jgi:ParB family chromosome partitioning protein
MQTNPGKGRRLGRGLSGLIGTPVEVPVTPPAGSAVSASSGGAGATEASGQRVVYIALTDIAPGRYQPRKKFDETALNELAASIRTAGLVQPVVVRLNPDGAPKFELVAGERRWRAAALAGLTVIPAIIAAISEEQAAEWSLIENLQRADLSVMERATAIKSLCDRFGATHGQIADRLGMDRTSVTNLLRLLELPDEIRAYIDQGLLNAGHGKVLLGIQPKVQLSLAVLAAKQGWPVRKLEEEITFELARLNGATVPEAIAAMKSGGGAAKPDAGALHTRAIVADLEKQLGDHFGTKVKIKTDRAGRSGRIEIRFYDLDHFDGIVAMTGFAMK